MCTGDAIVHYASLSYACVPSEVRGRLTGSHRTAQQRVTGLLYLCMRVKPMRALVVSCIRLHSTAEPAYHAYVRQASLLSVPEMPTCAVLVCHAQVCVCVARMCADCVACASAYVCGQEFLCVLAMLHACHVVCVSCCMRVMLCAYRPQTPLTRGVLTGYTWLARPCVPCLCLSVRSPCS